jgi:hypothetical protein
LPDTGAHRDQSSNKHILKPAAGNCLLLFSALESFVRAMTATMSDYIGEERRGTLISVMRKGTTYEREDVIYAVAHHLRFSRVTDAVRDPIKSSINSGIR